ncbi:hypothetical protein BU16DRAFT_78629 [Lophium mytilinum]|uniref:Uncharacterized protein n=1 Tax=Lophium mytilinum TaxID=390894 RepID=A0A6A6QN04_9PEZI|nr:hypothetical protein BU16DRAFT_78629 [Lophium mytilinum]
MGERWARDAKNRIWRGLSTREGVAWGPERVAPALFALFALSGRFDLSNMFKWMHVRTSANRSFSCRVKLVCWSPFFTRDRWIICGIAKTELRLRFALRPGDLTLCELWDLDAWKELQSVGRSSRDRRIIQKPNQTSSEQYPVTCHFFRSS